MIAWSNFLIMLLFIGLFTGLYIRSVSPAKLERKFGDKAYSHCGKVRAYSIVFLVLILINYLVYDLFPLPIPQLESFTWPYLVSLLLALLITVPTTYMLITGMKDAGDEVLQPDKDSEMFVGIYTQIRHPQMWEFMYFFAIALVLDNPFLAIFSLIWLPLMYLMMIAEEKDLVIRFGEEYVAYIDKTGRLFPRKN